MYPQSQFTTSIRPRRPRRTLEHLFGDDVDPIELLSGERFPRPAFPPVEVLPAPQPVAVPATRPRRVEIEDPTAPFGSSGEPFGSTRQRRTQPRDYLADDTAYARELQTAPIKTSRWEGFVHGGIPGLIRPERVGEMRRNQEIRRVDQRINRGFEFQKAQRGIRLEPLQERLLESQITENEAQAEARKRPPRPILGREVLEDGTTIQTELNPETGQFQPARGSDGQPIILARPKAPEPMVEMTLSDGRKVMVPQDKALSADATRESRLDRSQTRAGEQLSQKLAAQDELDQLTVDEVAAGDEKNRAYAYLSRLKADPNVTEDDIREATRAAEAANVFYRSFGPKKSAAKAKITRYSGSARPERPSTKTLSPDIEARIRAAATQRGLDPNIAIERARARQ